jgi:hypothetical protein
MKKKPSVLYFLSGTPTWTPEDCSNVTALNPVLNLNFTQDRMDDVDSYKSVMSSSSIMNDMTFLQGPNKTSLHNIYDSLAPMGQSVMGLLGMCMYVLIEAYRH